MQFVVAKNSSPFRPAHDPPIFVIAHVPSGAADPILRRSFPVQQYVHRERQ